MKLILPVDVQEPMRCEPTALEVGTMQGACWAAWTDPNGGNHFGVITAAHGLPEIGGEVPIGGGTETGVVVMKSNLRTQHLDVGFVEIDRATEPDPPLGPANVSVASASSLVNLIGTRTNDGVTVEGELWCNDAPRPMTASAFMVQYPIQYPNEQPFYLSDVVFAHGVNGTFARGHSGCTWAVRSQSGLTLAAAIQSHGHSPTYHMGIGTHFDAGVKWLASHEGVLNFRWRWRK